jgi:hypothetical protein
MGARAPKKQEGKSSLATRKRRMTSMKRRKELLDYATVFFALPFVLYLVVIPLIWVVEEVTPLAMILAFAFGAPIFFTDLFFRNGN